VGGGTLWCGARGQGAVRGGGAKASPKILLEIAVASKPSSVSVGRRILLDHG